MDPVDEAKRAALRDAFFKLQTPQDVAQLLQVSYSQLTFLLYGKDAAQRYTRFEIKKKSGQSRTILAPCPPLKLLQQRLNQVLQSVYRPKASVHGFVRGRSVVTNANLHVGQRYVLNVDLRDFFPSIHFGRVRGLFMAEPYKRNDKVATVLAQICCFGDPSALPQGAPTSPIVSNMICAKMDTELRRLAKDHRCQYTRYADDITFSTNQRRFPRQIARRALGQTTLGGPFEDVIARNWFSINYNKVRLQTRHERQEVTGLTTNEFVNVQRRYIRQIKAMLHAWQRYGLQNAELEYSKYDKKHRAHGTSPSFAEVVVGKLEFLGMVKGRSDEVYVNLVNWGRKLDAATFERLAIPEDAVWVLADSLYDPQGTAFALKEIGWITCGHTIAPNQDIHHARVGFKRYPITVKRRSLLHEICIFSASVEPAHPLSMGDPNVLRPGDPVTIVGYPDWGLGKTLQVTKAHVTGTNEVMHVKRINVDATIVPGNSGGPVLNARGEVVGIAVKGNYTRTNQSEFVPITLVKSLLALPAGLEERHDAFAPLPAIPADASEPGTIGSGSEP